MYNNVYTKQLKDENFFYSMITKTDLYHNKYDLETLKEHIYVLSMLDILKTQHLTAGFCVKYILNTNFHFCEEDEHITMEMVETLQPHISKREFVVAQVEAAKKRQRRERVDSVEDFQSFATRNS